MPAATMICGALENLEIHYLGILLKESFHVEDRRIHSTHKPRKHGLQAPRLG